MARAAVSYRFERAPSTVRYYPRALFGRRVGQLPPGSSVPRLEGEVAAIGVDAGHLARFRAVCGYADDAHLPIAYPHVLATPLQVAIATHPCFQFRLMGLIHVANQIDSLRPLPASGRYGAACWVEGHRDTERGQEIDLHTSLSDEQGVAWTERSTLLARGPVRSAGAARSARALLAVPTPPDGLPAASVSIRASRSVGRRYGLVSRDLNPIHLTNWSARRYGFDRAVAHGMWSMARSLAVLGPALIAIPRRVTVDFKLPLYLPGKASLEHWQEAGRWTFVLKDAQGQRPHLAGVAEPL